MSSLLIGSPGNEVIEIPECTFQWPREFQLLVIQLPGLENITPRQARARGAYQLSGLGERAC